MWRSLGFALVCCSCLGLRGATVTFSADADTTLIEHDPANNMGAQLFLNAGSIANTALRNRALIRFDLTQLPFGARITSAAVILEVVGEPSGGGEESNFRLHRVLRPWGEGTKIPTGGPPGQGVAASAGEATWNARFHPDQSWAAPGGALGADFVAEPSSDTFIYGVGDSPYVFPSNPTLLDDVNLWLDNPRSNFGWALISASENVPRTARRFASREDASRAPLLEITFELPLQLRNPRLEENRFTFDFNAEPSTTYTVLTSTNLLAAGWTTNSIVPSAETGREVTITAPPSERSEYFRVVANPD